MPVVNFVYLQVSMFSLLISFQCSLFNSSMHNMCLSGLEALDKQLDKQILNLKVSKHLVTEKCYELGDATQEHITSLRKAT